MSDYQEGLKAAREWVDADPMRKMFRRVDDPADPIDWLYLAQGGLHGRVAMYLISPARVHRITDWLEEQFAAG